MSDERRYHARPICRARCFRSFGPRRVLVVDDEPAARVLANRVFSEAGFEVPAVPIGLRMPGAFPETVARVRPCPAGSLYALQDGEETFRRLHEINPNVVALLSTGFLAPAQERIEHAGRWSGGFFAKTTPARLITSSGSSHFGEDEDVSRRLRRGEITASLGAAPREEPRANSPLAARWRQEPRKSRAAAAGP